MCAEDTQNSFTPAPGKIVRFVLPAGPGLRVDTGFAEGEEISADFDPLIAKIITWGPDRASAFGRLSRALEQTRILIDGGTTNLAFLRALIQREDVLRGDVDIGLIDRLEVTPPRGAAIAMVAAAVDRFLTEGDTASGENGSVEPVAHLSLPPGETYSRSLEKTELSLSITNLMVNFRVG